MSPGNGTGIVPLDTGDRFTYYSNGLLKEERNAGGLVAKWTYNNRGLPDAMLNGRLQKRTFEWDVNGRLKSFSDPDGTVEYEYDISGNMLSSKRGSGIIITDPAPLTVQSADSAKGIKRRTAADTDSSGRLLRSTAAGDAEEPVDVSRSYDDLHRVTSYTNPAGETIGYEYDSAGNLYKLSYPDGKTVTYAYDKADRLIGVTDWAQRKTVYHYDANGRLEKTERPNGTVQQREYDAAGQLTLLEDLDAWDNVVVRFRYFYNAAGEIVRESMEPESAVFSVSLPLNMAYGDYNRLALWNGQDVAFDADNNLTYGPLGGGFAGFEYDSRNRLTKAGDIEYVYDSEDTRVAAVDNGQRTDYTVDPNHSLSRLLVKTDPDGGKMYYVYGLGLIGEESGGQYTAYHFDLRGSTVALTDSSGYVMERFGYSPYGVLMSGNASRTPFLFNGMYGVMSDANGLYYMRARFYHPQLRRFLNLDPLRGDVVSGQNINRFAYSYNNPISHIDPQGEVAFLVPLLWLAGGTGLGLAADAAYQSYAMPWFEENLPQEIVDSPGYYTLLEHGSEIVGVAGGAARGVIKGIQGALPSNILQRSTPELVVNTLNRSGLQQKLLTRLAQNIKNNPLRQAYEKEVAQLARYQQGLIEQSTYNKALANIANLPGSEKILAEAAHSARRQLGIKYKNLTPEPLRDYIYEINTKRYGDPLGPSVELLVQRGKTYRQIIESAARPNPDVDKLLEGFGKWLSAQPDSYIQKHIHLILGE